MEIADKSESLLMVLLAISEINEYLCLYCRTTVQCRAQSWPQVHTACWSHPRTLFSFCPSAPTLSSYNPSADTGIILGIASIRFISHLAIACGDSSTVLGPYRFLTSFPWKVVSLLFHSCAVNMFGRLICLKINSFFFSLFSVGYFQLCWLLKLVRLYDHQ